MSAELAEASPRPEGLVLPLVLFRFLQQSHIQHLSAGITEGDVNLWLCSGCGGRAQAGREAGRASQLDFDSLFLLEARRRVAGLR